jgi:hypothetical protein
VKVKVELAKKDLILVQEVADHKLYNGVQENSLHLEVIMRARHILKGKTRNEVF